jgi:hypothetical protein
MRSPRRTTRVTTVVTAICIGAALTGPAVASAGLDNESDSSSTPGDSTGSSPGGSTGSTDTRTPSLGSLGIPGITTQATPGGAGDSGAPTGVGPSGDDLPESTFGNGRPPPSYTPPTGEGTSEGPQPGPVEFVPPVRIPIPFGCEFLPCAPPGDGGESQEEPQPGPTPPSDFDEPAPGPAPAQNPPPTGTPGDSPVGLTPGPANRVPAGVDAPASAPSEVPAASQAVQSQAATIKLTSAVGTGTAAMTLILIVLISGIWFYGNRLGSHLTVRRNNHA